MMEGCVVDQASKSGEIFQMARGPFA